MEEWIVFRYEGERRGGLWIIHPKVERNVIEFRVEPRAEAFHARLSGFGFRGFWRLIAL